MLKDVAEKYYRLGYNCAETLFLAGNEYYSLNCSEESFRLFSAYGAGFQCGDLCGALVASTAVLSMLVVKTKAHDIKEELRSKEMGLVKKFQCEMGGRKCCEIKARWHDPVERCLPTVLKSAEILEEYLKSIGIEVN